jgi:radical SAM protein with 4Fe4S-binding SPASM domain
MSWEIAKNAIDYSIKQCKQHEIEHIQLSFHGQGEPTLSWVVFCKAVDYFSCECSLKGLKGTINLTTNGTFSGDKVEYLKSHDVQLTISMDCCSANLDKLRPTITGKSTLKLLENTLYNLESHQLSFGIRGTVTELNVSEMSDLVNFLSKYKMCESIHFQPLILSGRAKNEKLEKSFYDRYVENFEDAKSLGIRKGLNVVCSGSEVNDRPDTFCSAIGRNLNFCISAEGLISSCFEQLDFNDDVPFIYGKLTTDSVDIIRDKYIHLKKNFKLREMCYRCFLLPTCRGDCPSRRSYSDDLTCYLNRKIAKTNLFVMSLQSKFENKDNSQI